MKLLHSVPAFPVTHLDRSTAFYRDKLGFSVAFQKEGFVKLVCDAVELHLWLANDEQWHNRDSSKPVVSGAESFIAGTHSCRIALEGVNEFYNACVPAWYPASR